MKLERDARKHGHRSKRPKEVPATVPEHLEPLIDFVAELIANEAIKELTMDIEGDQRNDHIKAENVPGL